MKILALSLFTFLTIQSFAQITTTKVLEKPQKETTIYDSLSNFLGKNCALYVGQTFYLKGLSEPLRRRGYRSFYLDYHNEFINDNKNVYKSFDGYGSKYEDLAERYFEVLEVIAHPKSKESEYLYGHIHYLKIKEKISGDVCYFEYDEKSEHRFPFIVVGYFEKLKIRLVGKKFVISTPYFEGAKDYQTNKVITNKGGQAWECIDLTIDEEFYNLSVIWKNEFGEKVIDAYDYLFELGGKSQIFTMKEANDYKAKFGLSNWLSILNRKLKIGMTEEMCRVAWGEPKKINHSSSGDQWVYDKEYLYFEGGKLKSFN